MVHKIKQFIQKYRYTPSNRIPNLRSRQFLLNHIRLLRRNASSAAMRAAMGLLRLRVMQAYHNENRIKYNSICFITGRTRGVYKRYNIARVRIRKFSSEGKLFGVKKAS